MATALKVSRLQKRGQVTIPIEIRQKLGLEEGDLVAFFETQAGVVISPQEVVPASALNKLLEDRGVGLDELFTFADRIAPRTQGEEPEARSSKAEASIANQTAGIFWRPDRTHPADFEELRKEFIEETAKRVRTETSNQQG